jgi:hypothetical protein
MFAKKNGLSWNKKLIANVKSIGISPKVFAAFAPDGFECIVFPDNDSLRYYKNNGSSWVLTSKFYLGTLKKGSIQNYGIDKNNNLLVTAVYNNDTLHYLSFNGKNWTSESIAAIDINNFCANAEADSIAKPFIAYREKATNNLVIAFKEIPIVSNIGEANSNIFTYYPNPVNSIITIESQLNQNIGMVTIYNISGQILKTQKLTSNKTKIDLSDLSQGFYLMKIRADKKTEVIKIVKK